MKSLFRTSLLTAIVLLGSFAVNADTQIAPSPTSKMDGDNKVVAIYGNSYTHYNNNLNTRLRDLARSLLPNNAKGYSYRGITISSGQLGWHEQNLRFQNTLKSWDVVVFQGNSMEPITKKASSREYFEESAKTMAKIAHDAGSKVVYFMTWAQKTRPEQTELLSRAYQDIARETGGYVAPVGLAFEQSNKQFPEIDLYHSDGKHPSVEGTYLAASVLFATLYNESPVGGAIPVDTDMSVETANKLQTVAWDSVRQFQENQ